jgi:hypothetical protein
MKKSLLIGAIVLASGASVSLAQYITLDNYFSGFDLPLTFGVGVPLNGVSGAVAASGTPLNSNWTVGLYYIGGTIAISDPAGAGIPIAPLALGTGTGSTTKFDTQNAVGSPGYFGSIYSFNTGSTLNTTVTLEVVVWDSAAPSYATALYRVHSAPFTMPTVSATSPAQSDVGDYMQPFSVGEMGDPTYYSVTPEPATLVLTGLGLVTLLILRRKKFGVWSHHVSSLRRQM